MKVVERVIGSGITKNPDQHRAQQREIKIFPAGFFVKKLLWKNSLCK